MDIHGYIHGWIGHIHGYRGYPWASWISIGYSIRDAVIIKLAILLNTLTSVVQWRL